MTSRNLFVISATFPNSSPVWRQGVENRARVAVDEFWTDRKVANGKRERFPHRLHVQQEDRDFVLRM